MRSIVRKYYELLCYDDIIYNKLKNKYPELKDHLDDIRKNIISEKKENIINYLEIKINLEKDNEYIENMFLDERLTETRKRIDHNWEIADKEEIKNETMSFEILDSNKVYKIKKGDKYWSEFKQNIASKIFFQNFSILEKKNHLEVYFI
jgi:hypothetical protein